jgi:hypothetical protein
LSCPPFGGIVQNLSLNIYRSRIALTGEWPGPPSVFYTAYRMTTRNAILTIGGIVVSTLLTLSVQGCYTSGVGYTDSGAAPAAYNIDDLNAYGEWVPLDNYGRGWRPYAVADWMPFDNGHWAYADGAWTWISYEPFGWMVYHYGYWYNDPIYGWAWIPSDESWSPARVGWAPLPPPGASRLIGFISRA